MMKEKQQVFLFKLGTVLKDRFTSGDITLNEIDDIKMVIDNLLPTSKDKINLIEDLTNIYYI